MHEGMMHIRDVEGLKKTGSVEARLEAMEQQVFKFQGIVERGLNANHMMITEFTNKHKIDANDIGKHLSRLYDRIDHLQAQIYDLQNQNWLIPPAPDVETSDPSKIEDEGMIEPRDAVSEEVLELEVSEPSGEHVMPPLVDWTDDDETHHLRMMQPWGRMLKRWRKSPALL
ncbi:40S ribosomal protein S5-1 [Hordeum vulgare]|nr:40S ribosomal protein S5-1 [Hordeum vulgare]